MNVVLHFSPKLLANAWLSSAWLSEVNWYFNTKFSTGSPQGHLTMVPNYDQHPKTIYNSVSKLGQLQWPHSHSSLWYCIMGMLSTDNSLPPIPPWLNLKHLRLLPMSPRSRALTVPCKMVFSDFLHQSAGCWSDGYWEAAKLCCFGKPILA